MKVSLEPSGSPLAPAQNNSLAKVLILGRPVLNPSSGIGKKTESLHRLC